MNESISAAMAKIYAYDQERPALIAAGNQALVRLAPSRSSPPTKRAPLGASCSASTTARSSLLT
ncbi:hypothetical protein [Pseudomonas aeruginosa]|uniref:hypothetical protein n=1 Tax=Pseudomonas aeruginosa TaxID=287 RepID=UPI000AD949F5|nr:hypothetical protein [Pseudomonas aeruginosa]